MFATYQTLFTALVGEPDSAAWGAPVPSFADRGAGASPDRVGVVVPVEVARQAEHTPDAIALRRPNGSHVTYGALARRAREIARLLSEHGVATGELVGIAGDLWTSSPPCSAPGCADRDGRSTPIR